jgi:hypothetical protein
MHQQYTRSVLALTDIYKQRATSNTCTRCHQRFAYTLAVLLLPVFIGYTRQHEVGGVGITTTNVQSTTKDHNRRGP